MLFICAFMGKLKLLEELVTSMVSKFLGQHGPEFDHCLILLNRN